LADDEVSGEQEIMKLCPVCHTAYDDQPRFCIRDGSQLVETLPGARLIGERFQITQLVRNGRMGDIYLAMDLRDARQVMVKILPPHLFADLQAKTLFTENVTKLVALRCPQLVDYIAVLDLQQGHVGLVTEYVVGHDLRHELNAQTQFSAQRALTVIRETAEGLAAAQMLGVSHYDLKPENLLLLADAETQELRLKVADIGLACLKASMGGSIAFDTGSETIRMPYYTSPEKCQGEAFDLRSDIYSLGVILYEMLAGHPPFQSEAPARVLVMHATQPPPPIREQNPSVNEDVAGFLEQMLAKNPGERFQTLQAVRDGCVTLLMRASATELYKPNPKPLPLETTAEPTAPAPPPPPAPAPSLDLPLRLTIIDADDEGNKSRTIPGSVQDASVQGMRIITGTVSTGHLNIVRDHTVAFKNRLEIEVDLPDGTISIDGFAVRYNRAPDGINWIVYIYIKDMPRNDRRRYEEFVRNH
jgi:eukaryotic-like serine/threonine-protein kinase